MFFDGVAVLVPDYMRDRPLSTDPSLAQPLADQGLLHRLSPETLVDQNTAEALSELLDDLLTAGAFDGLDPKTAFAELSAPQQIGQWPGSSGPAVTWGGSVN